MTNGNTTISCKSESFVIQKQAIIPNEVTITISDTQYETNNSIVVYYTPIVNATTIRVYLVKDDDKQDITKAYNDTQDGSCFQFTLPDEEVANAYILFELTNGNTTISCKSRNFRIIQLSSHQSCKTCRKSSLFVMIWVVSTLVSTIYIVRRKYR